MSEIVGGKGQEKLLEPFPGLEVVRTRNLEKNINKVKCGD